MRPTTFICALAATLQLLSGAALADGWTWPVRGPVLTAYRNGGDPYAAGQHRGIDIGAPVGTRVAAATAGTVTFSGVVGSAGLVVSQRTADGRFDLSYLHLSSTAVHRGDALAAGTIVGAVGTSGRRSTEAPHLHFGVREAGARSAYRDPLGFLAPPPAADRPTPAPWPVPVPAGEPALADPAPPAVPTGHAQSAPTPASPGPAPAPFHHPVHLPLGSGVPVLVPTHRLSGETVPHGAGDPHVRGATLPRILAPGASPQRAGTPQPDSNGTSATGAERTAGVGPSGSRTPAPSHPEPTAARPLHHGVNLGWLAACAGLIALATALGHPDGTRRTAARGRRLAAGARGRRLTAGARAVAAKPRRRGRPPSGAATRGGGGPTSALRRHLARQ
jgi:hypothetical protein